MLGTVLWVILASIGIGVVLATLLVQHRHVSLSFLYKLAAVLFLSASVAVLLF